MKRFKNWLFEKCFEYVVQQMKSGTATQTPEQLLCEVWKPEQILDFCFTRFATTMCHNETVLTPEMLIEAGWVVGTGTNTGNKYLKWPDIKERDQIIVEFENHYYRVWYGRNGTFISLQVSAEWFAMFLLLQDKHRQFFTHRDLFKLWGAQENKS